MGTHRYEKPGDGSTLSTSQMPDHEDASHYSDSLLDDRKIVGDGVPTKPSEASWKDYIAVVCCMVACALAFAIVYVDRWAAFFGFKAQYAWIGACLTVMTWCTLPFVRRLFLCSAVSNKRSSNLQTLDAILRSDPLTENANIGTRALLIAMLALSPGLSVAYKLLNPGQSYYNAGPRNVKVGLTGPPGTQHMGYGMSQFVNATIPWFEYPAFRRTYGYNMFVVDENTTALLDAPLPDDMIDMQAELGDFQALQIKGVVSATVCSLNPDLNYNKSQLTVDFDKNNVNDRPNSYAGQRWVWAAENKKAMFLPNNKDVTNIYLASYNTTKNQTFGDLAERYTLVRQNYTATWLVTRSFALLASAVPLPGQILDHKGVFTNLAYDSALPQLMIDGFVEYDTTFRGIFTSPDKKELYHNYIKTEATLVATAVWARFVAWLGPETWFLPGILAAYPEQMNTLSYEVVMDTERGAFTVQRGWGIIVTLLAFPVLLITAFTLRLAVWSLVPIGPGFGVISLLASIDPNGRKRMDGAGLSGRLKHALSLQFIMGTSQNQTNIKNTGSEIQCVTTLLGESYRRPTERLHKGVVYR